MLNRWRITLILIFVFMLVAVPLAAQRLHSSHSGGVIDPTCNSTQPCIQYVNKAEGPAIRGDSVLGDGLIGSTTAIGSSAANAKTGVYGIDLSNSNTSLFNTGVLGSSYFGTGVRGHSVAGIGVSSVSDQFAALSVLGGGDLNNGNGPDIPALSIVGDISQTPASGKVINDLIDACRAGTAVPCDSNHWIFTVDGYGDVATMRSFEAFATEPGVTGVVSHSGIMSSSTSTGVFAGCLKSSGYEFEGASTASVNFTVDCSGAIQTVVRTRNNMYATPNLTRSTLPVIEDYGEAQLVNGTATVRLDPTFSEAISDTSPYLVFLTPDGDTNGLYVAYKTPAAFQVREVRGGRSTLAFDYRIVGRPANDEHQRMSLSTRPPGIFPKMLSPLTKRP